METTRYVTVKLGGRHTIVDEAKANPDALHVWEFTHTEITGEDEIEAGRRATGRGLFGTGGGFDQSAVLISKGYTLLERLVKQWTRQSGDGAALPVTPENVLTVPSVVAKQFAADMLFGKIPDEAEIEAAKKPTPTATPATAPPE